MLTMGLVLGLVFFSFLRFLRMGLPPIDWALAFVVPPWWRQAALVGLELSGSGRKEVLLFPNVTKAPGISLVLLLVVL